MKLVAVIDLLGGQVVHARRGDRAKYASIRSTLCDGSDPATVAAALISLHRFEAIYIADLDAIQRRDGNVAALRAIARAAQGIDLWIDAGISNLLDVDRFRAEGYGSMVIGSESLRDCVLVDRLRSAGDDYVLSLDFRRSAFLGPKPLLDSPHIWPTRVLAMNLDFVGSALGPDLQLVRTLRNAAPSTRIYASGGLRNEGDLAAAYQAGASGALLATSLHDGSLSAYFKRLRGNNARS
jgi:phosphoribosylformimino-5-aminoimidazole carboxamide ribotide isomerase